METKNLKIFKITWSDGNVLLWVDETREPFQIFERFKCSFLFPVAIERTESL